LKKKYFFLHNKMSYPVNGVIVVFLIISVLAIVLPLVLRDSASASQPSSTVTVPVAGNSVTNDLTIQGNFEITNRWQVSDTGNFVPYTSGTFDMGTDASRIRTGYFTGLSVDGPGSFQDNLFVGNEATTTKGIEVGNSGAAGTAPYIDFRFGTGTPNQDFNMRIINNGDRRLAINTGNLGEVLILDDANLAINVQGNLVPTSEYGGGIGVTYIRNASGVPGFPPTDGGILYVDAGALTYRGSSGSVTVIAPA